MKKMTRDELLNTAKAVAEQNGHKVTKADLEIALAAIAGGIRSGLANGMNVTLPEIGVLKVSVRAASVARNPRTGEEVQVGARAAVSFTASKAIKDTLVENDTLSKLVAE